MSRPDSNVVLQLKCTYVNFSRIFDTSGRFWILDAGGRLSVQNPKLSTTVQNPKSATYVQNPNRKFNIGH